MESKSAMSEKPRMLIEVAMPVKEVSSESVRDKSIRHGHISTLHLWWARRPLPVCRATVFASLVPDPEDERCSPAYLEAVDQLIGVKAKEPYRSEYRPYEDIPHTAVKDLMPDTRRNRLLMFIGKFSSKYVENERLGKKTPPKDTLSNYSLIKWESRENEDVLNIARKLIWVAHDEERNTLAEFDAHWKAIKKAREAYADVVDPHEVSDALKLSKAYDDAVQAFQERMPRVFDPFAGGGAIPLEAARLGCRSYGNDINPVAHIIQRASLEFPQKFGQPIVYSEGAYVEKYGDEAWGNLPAEWKDYDRAGKRIVRIPNRLSHDVEYEALALLSRAEAKIGHLYPKDEEGNKPIAYYWARTAKCSNPSCRAEVPLLKQFYLANTSRRKVHLKPIIEGTKIEFEIHEGATKEEGWMNRANLTCPCCGNLTAAKELKKQFKADFYKQRLVAVIWDNNGSGKAYRLPTAQDLGAFPLTIECERPSESLSTTYTQALPSCTWGLETWGQMFSNRQLLAMQTLVDCIPEKLKTAEEGSYAQAVASYLGIQANRMASRLSSFCIWDNTTQKTVHPFGRQAIPMVFDYPESNPFSDKTGGFTGQLAWVLRYINSEVNYFSSDVIHAASGDKKQFKEKSLNAVVTDPPYYDAIAYADLSDFYYVWFKRTLSGCFSMNFITPQTPKGDECTALKHHHNGDAAKAESHFEDMLQRIFSAIEWQTDGPVSIMFAHQSTKAWTTLCNSVLGANMNLMASWAADSELNTALKANKAFLSSSVTVACKPHRASGIADFKELKSEINGIIQLRVKELYSLGFRGADLLTACFGHAVAVFGQYKNVEKADGSTVEVNELLDFAREAAFNAIVSDFKADEPTRFYIGWLNLHGFTKASHDDVNKIIQIGLSIDSNQLISEHILERKGGNEQLMSMKERMQASNKIGSRASDRDIDKCHRMMFLWDKGDTSGVVDMIRRFAPYQEHELWRVMNALYEVLPNGCDDHNHSGGILSSLEMLLREAKKTKQSSGEQATLEL